MKTGTLIAILTVCAIVIELSILEVNKQPRQQAAAPVAVLCEASGTNDAYDETPVTNNPSTTVLDTPQKAMAAAAEAHEYQPPDPDAVVALLRQIDDGMVKTYGEKAEADAAAATNMQAAIKAIYYQGVLDTEKSMWARVAALLQHPMAIGTNVVYWLVPSYSYAGGTNE